MTFPELAQHRLIINLSSAILPLLTQTTPMWDEIQDMPGEIFDVPDIETVLVEDEDCLLYTSPSPRDLSTSRMPSSA